MTFAYHEHIRWLPASLDRNSSWQTFFNLLALSCSFWAVFDWVRTRHNSFPPSFSNRSCSTAPLCPRLRTLLWVLTISGGLLGLEGIVQRFGGSNKLLFIAIPEIHKEAHEQFASYAYRANAGQYFNLLWPVSFGFWWTTSRCGEMRRVTSHILLGCALIMAACPIISSARGAALVGLAMLVIATAALLLSLVLSSVSTYARTRSVLLLLLFFIGALGLGLANWRHLPIQLNSLAFGLAERERLYACAERIAADYPLFGVGPGSFEKVFQLYRSSADGYWPTQLHNDWLETRLTWGWVGSGMMAFAISIVLLNFIGRVRSRRTSPLAWFLCLSLFGCLVQARWDFPLQIYSIEFLFVLWCAALFVPHRLNFN